MAKFEGTVVGFVYTNVVRLVSLGLIIFGIEWYSDRRRTSSFRTGCMHEYVKEVSAGSLRLLVLDLHNLRR